MDGCGLSFIDLGLGDQPTGAPHLETLLADDPHPVGEFHQPVLDQIGGQGTSSGSTCGVFCNTSPTILGPLRKTMISLP